MAVVRFSNYVVKNQIEAFSTNLRFFLPFSNSQSPPQEKKASLVKSHSATTCRIRSDDPSSRSVTGGASQASPAVFEIGPTNSNGGSSGPPSSLEFQVKKIKTLAVSVMTYE